MELSEHLEPSALGVIQSEVERQLLGGPRRYTREQVAEVAGVPLERAQRLWVSMGFAIDANPGAVMFTDGDAAALRALVRFVDGGALEPDAVVAATRALGQSMSRLAEWQVAVLNSRLADQLAAARDHAGTLDEDALRTAVDTLTADMLPVVEALQSYVWRRHLAAATARRAGSVGEETTHRTLVVGFADMVGYTSLTRRIRVDELSALLEEFESRTTAVITQGGGWVIKNVGDEVMFAAEQPSDAARIALALQSAHREGPDLRVGMAFGPVLVRFGDLFGEPVNIAARLTSAARAGTILVGTELAASLDDDDELALRSLRPLRVRGYSRLRAFALRARRRPASS
ncbi:adenylate/guanylate cyclase domain-containing protein [Rhodococcus sp. SGAir0479]|uniref:adenylate/guanylate cyclase domain-containing protein n=1 Tax=Rhodococcus sp. SGAir0479 TaxID=2567884 RepID=UPI0010CCF55A|nr:adenylate/guanylate cyclase domain-containing protein [Rhodococcus sp. SGAir0479]QCQ92751.1 adenylate/guanylate cyclase domain-containing protein [Rhodococcus sp. SGAir0479]